MKIRVKKYVDYDVTHLKAECDVRYWEDATVDGVEDADGTLIPCREGNSWCPVIELATGRIINWKLGTVAIIHYKVCDCGTYSLLDENGNTCVRIDGYVPNTMSPKERGYGDYVIMDVNADGFIQNWSPHTGDFQPQENDE